MAHNPDSPLFAGRYRFEPVSHDWDRGRSGYTHLVYDLKEERPGVIKRAETISQQSTEGLKNEVRALKALKGLGVPEVYDTGQAVYGSKNYDYLVIEYIDGIRVEKNLNFFTVVERADIITKLFGLLSQAHQKGIVNGDVDLKHLFLRKGKKQLVVIDWGNAKLGVDPKKKTEFAYDLARAAEIIFSLVSGTGHPPATGSLSLPGDSVLVAGIESLPMELRDLCKWAPRTPSDGAQAPYTAQELYEVSKKWLHFISGSTTLPAPRPAARWRRLIWILLLPLVAGILFLAKSMFPIFQATPATASATSMIVSSETPSIVPSIAAPVTEITETIAPTSVSAETATSAPVVIPPPGNTYAPIITFDNLLEPNGFLAADKNECWKENQNSPTELLLNDGFSRRDDQYWRFKVVKEHTIEDQ